MTVQRNEIIEHIVEMVASILCKHGIVRPVAEQVGNDFADEITTTYGGKQFCIPQEIDTYSNVKTKSAKTAIKEKTTERRYELLAFIEKAIASLTSDLPLKNLTPAEAGTLASDKFTQDFLNKNFVVPMDAKYKRYQRDQKLLKEFNGLNMRDLSDKYDLSESAIYRILRKY